MSESHGFIQAAVTVHEVVNQKPKFTSEVHTRGSYAADKCVCRKHLSVTRRCSRTSHSKRSSKKITQEDVITGMNERHSSVCRCASSKSIVMKGFERICKKEVNEGKERRRERKKERKKNKISHYSIEVYKAV